MTLPLLIKDPSPGITPGDGSIIRTDQHDAIVDYLSGESNSGNINHVMKVVTKTSSYTVLEADGLVLVDCTSGNVPITLPDATVTGMKQGKIIGVKKIDSTSNTSTISGTSAQTMDGFSSVILSQQYCIVWFQSDGSNWRIIDRYWYNTITDETGAVMFAVLKVASSVNYLRSEPSATGNDVALTAQGSDSNISLDVKAKGTGSVKIIDGNGNIIEQFASVSSAVNYIQAKNSATGVALEIDALGTDSNISIKLVPKGTGEVFGNSEMSPFALGDESTPPGQTTNTIVKKNTLYAQRAGKIVWVEQCCTIAPTGTVTFDVLLNGTTIFSTRPTIAGSANTGSNGVLTNNPQTIAKGDKIEICYYNVGASETIAGAKITLGFYRTS